MSLRAAPTHTSPSFSVETLKEIWLLGSDRLRRSSKPRPLPRSRCVRRGGVSFCSPTRDPRGHRQAPGYRGASVATSSETPGSCARCADAGAEGRSTSCRRPKRPWREAGPRSTPPRSASSRQPVRPRRAHWPCAPQPAIGSRALFYIDRSGPIGARRLLNMHAGRQSASAGAGPPRAVAKLGLPNCY